ncbi:MAG: adenylosuccinate lyase [Planctomycetota bacterium]
MSEPPPPPPTPPASSSPDDRYISPLSTRNASPEMQAIWSANRKFKTWRRLWLALAEAEAELGIEISASQLEELRNQIDAPIDYAAARAYEQKLRHDVMAHVHTLGDAAPNARPIIHLGATSQFVVCNTELLQVRDALKLIAQKTATAIARLGDFADQYKDLPTLGFTHYQPAQPTTVGKRATLWAQDLAIALAEIEHRLDTLRFRGVKGTTGTQASFLALFDNDASKVDRLDKLVTTKMGWPIDKRFAVTGQTYPRLMDALIVSSLSAIAAAAMKCATDLRLLANRKEIEEPFEKNQIGSSAMAYKRNPMRSERICGLARFVIGMTQTPYTTAAEQWMERTLDDSSCRRLTLPEPFLALDGVLDLLINVTGGLVVYEKTIAANLAAELPFMATENLLMAAVQAGGDRQELHEVIRTHSQAAAAAVKAEGQPNDLLDRLKTDPNIEHVDLNAALNPAAFVGRAPEQVEAFLAEVVAPIRDAYDTNSLATNLVV